MTERFVIPNADLNPTMIAKKTKFIPKKNERTYLNIIEQVDEYSH